MSRIAANPRTRKAGERHEYANAVSVLAARRSTQNRLRSRLSVWTKQPAAKDLRRVCSSSHSSGDIACEAVHAIRVLEDSGCSTHVRARQDRRMAHHRIYKAKRTSSRPASDGKDALCRNEANATSCLALQNDRLMSKYRVLCLKPDFRRTALDRSISRRSSRSDCR
jgi:hypothetical protein